MNDKPWYEKEKSQEDMLYEESVLKVKNAVRQGLPFKKAAELVDVEDGNLRRAILDDALKVIIAEEHFSGGKPIAELVKILKLPEAEIQKARGEMLKDVEAAAIEQYKDSLGDTGHEGNA